MNKITKEEAWDEFMKYSKDILIKWGGTDHLNRVKSCFYDITRPDDTYANHIASYNKAIQFAKK